MIKMAGKETQEIELSARFRFVCRAMRHFLLVIIIVDRTGLGQRVRSRTDRMSGPKPLKTSQIVKRWRTSQNRSKLTRTGGKSVGTGFSYFFKFKYLNIVIFLFKFVSWFVFL